MRFSLICSVDRVCGCCVLMSVTHFFFLATDSNAENVDWHFEVLSMNSNRILTLLVGCLFESMCSLLNFQHQWFTCAECDTKNIAKFLEPINKQLVCKKVFFLVKFWRVDDDKISVYLFTSCKMSCAFNEVSIAF